MNPQLSELTVKPVELNLATCDTSGENLGLKTIPTAHSAVASKALHHLHLTNQYVILFEVLAASHRVTVRPRNSSQEYQLVTETVACEPPNLGQNLTSEPSKTVSYQKQTLPTAHTWSNDGWDFLFSSQTRTGNEALQQATDRIFSLDEGLSLAARFPGHHQSITALTFEPESFQWQTWHLYPGAEPHLVTTTTTCRQQL